MIILCLLTLKLPNICWYVTSHYAGVQGQSHFPRNFAGGFVSSLSGEEGEGGTYTIKPLNDCTALQEGWQQ